MPDVIPRLGIELWAYRAVVSQQSPDITEPDVATVKAITGSPLPARYQETVLEVRFYFLQFEKTHVQHHGKIEEARRKQKAHN